MPVTLANFAKDAAAYTLWANRRLVNWLREQPADIIEKEVPSSFPSIRETLTHIWFVQKGWMATLQGLPTESNYGQSFEGSLEDLYEGFIEQTEQMTYYILSLNEVGMQERCAFKVPIRWPEWDDFERAAFEIIQHVSNHGNYHRGQIITMARVLGLSNPPMTDYMCYLINP